MASLFPPLPAFLDLAGRPVVVTSGEAGLAPLCERLAAAGAGVSVFDPTPSAAIEACAGVRLVRRRWRSADFKGAMLVVAGVANGKAARVRAAAKAARAMVVAMGAPESADFAFGADVSVGPIAIGVGAVGLDPAVADAVRGRIEAALPPGLEGFLRAAQRYETDISEALPSPEARSAFWRAAAQQAFHQPQADWDAWLAHRVRQAIGLTP